MKAPDTQKPSADALKPPLRARLLGGAAKLISPRLDKGVGRIRQLMLVLGLAYLGVAVKLTHLGFSHEPPQTLKAAADLAAAGARPDLLDRNGAILATDVKTMSVFAEPRNVIDKDEAVELITAVLPDVNARELRERLNSRKGFIWIKRHVTSKERNEIFHLGLPGIGFWPENERVYPNGPLAAHVLGFVDKDNIGIAGMEKYLDQRGLTDPHVPGFVIDPAALKPVRLSLDLKATHVLRDELLAGMDKFKAKAAAGAILDVDTGEVIALESLPDFDPNDPPDFTKPENRNKINRINVGTYEMGSTFKALTLAMGLDSGKFTLGSKLDARESLRSGHFTIHDFEPKHRFLSFPEVFTFSSNIGTARIAMAMGIAAHQAFLRKMGQLTRLQTELPESAAPQIPKHWGLLNTMTIAFGQGLNVAPLQALMGVAALLNGGHLMKPTFLVRDEATAMANSEQVVSAQTSESMRYLMRSNATHGSARKANIEGYYVGGKTGTAQKIVNHRYSKDKVFTTFMAVVPADKPKYLYMAIYDQPQSVPGDGGFHTAAYNAGRTTGALIERVEPLEGVPPMLAPPTNPFPILAKLGYGGDADRTKE